MALKNNLIDEKNKAIEKKIKHSKKNHHIVRLEEAIKQQR